MVKLGDILSCDKNERLILSSVSEGDVFRMHLDKEEHVQGKKTKDDGRNKYFILIGKDKEGNAIGFVLINSQINPYLPTKRQLLHYPLSAQKYNFLEGKNRFVDCSDFKIISQKKFSELFDGNKIKGRIMQEDIDIIRATIADYEDASPKMLKRFGLITK